MVRKLLAIPSLCFLTATSVVSEEPVQTRLSWSEDVRPALEAGICPAALASNRDEAVEPCGLLPDHHAAADLASLMSERLPVLARLRSLSRRANAARPAGAEQNLNTVADSYREIALDEPRVLAGILPETVRILERHSLVCSDCPRQRGPTELTFEAMGPYLAAFVWPVAIRPDGSLRLDICVGSNGLDRIEEVDEDLAEAAVISLLHNREAMALIGPHVQSAMASSDYQGTEDDDERLEIIRHHLAEGLTSDQEFLAAVRSQAEELLPLVGLRCVDCA